MRQRKCLEIICGKVYETYRSRKKEKKYKYNIELVFFYVVK